MKKMIDIHTWKRKEHFDLFSTYQEPFFSIATYVDCTGAYSQAKSLNISFFIYYMYQSLVAANTVEEFRYRIEDGHPVIYDKIHGSTTTFNADNLFAFSFLPYHEDLMTFNRDARSSLLETKKIKGINLNEDSKRIDVIHYSTIPWISFTAITHERNFIRPDSIPKITFGKYIKEKNRLMMPVSICAHHGLLDGFHVGKYLEVFQKLLDQ